MMHDSDEEEEQTALVCDNGKKITYFSRKSKSEINFLKWEKYMLKICLRKIKKLKRSLKLQEGLIITFTLIITLRMSCIKLKSLYNIGYIITKSRLDRKSILKF